ncbi:MAG: hypothetical protein J1E37_03275 [Prevotella sp.]|nr:hypothetical protein [Prevotella sp.]
MFWGGYNIRINNGVSQISKIHNTNSELNDYKLFCFNGKCRLFKIDFGRFVEHHANYYDTDLQLLPFGEVVCPPVYDINIPIPSIIVDMFSQAEKLAKDIPFLRVDFYNVNNHIYFGELTFYPASGLSPFTSRQWDLKLGEMIDLPHLL